MNSKNGSIPSTKRTVVEEGTHFQGNLTSTCPIDVRGRVEGDIQAPSLTVSAAGAVHGHAKVGSVHSQGELSGEFEADTIELSGTVKDKTVIRARSLEVKISSARGQQVVFGDCELSVGDEPTEHDRIDESAVAVAEAPASTGSVVPPGVEAEAALASDATSGEAPAEASTAEADAANTPGASATTTDDDPALADDEAKPVANSIHEALASEAEADQGKAKNKGKGRNKENGTETVTGWSQPPSQPPPAH